MPPIATLNKFDSIRTDVKLYIPVTFSINKYFSNSRWMPLISPHGHELSQWNREYPQDLVQRSLYSVVTHHWKSPFIDANYLTTATEVTRGNSSNAHAQHSFLVLHAGVYETGLWRTGFTRLYCVCHHSAVFASSGSQISAWTVVSRRFSVVTDVTYCCHLLMLKNYQHVIDLTTKRNI